VTDDTSKQRFSKPLFGIIWIVLVALLMALAAAGLGNELKYLMYFPLLIASYVGYVLTLVIQALACDRVTSRQSVMAFLLWLGVTGLVYVIMSVKVDEIGNFDPMVIVTSALFALGGLHLVKAIIVPKL